MAKGKVIFYVKPLVYRGQDGFRIGSRGSGRTGIFGISIFVTDRGGAERIRDAYKAEAAGHINEDELDAIVGAVFDAERAA